MMPTRLQTKAVSQFSCLGADCPDTCCQGWGMQVTQETVAQYKQQAPELLNAIVSDDGAHLMRRDMATDMCVKFDAGLCGIHRDYGDAFLGDACYFFPRITRAIGTTVLTTAALSCPETARLMLYGEDALAWTAHMADRAPYILKNYLPHGLKEEDALAIHAAFLDMVADASVTAEQGVLRVSTVARALEHQSTTLWREAVPMYAAMADSRIPQAEAVASDMFNLVQALYGLVMASPSPRARLIRRLDAMAQMLGISFHANNEMHLADDAMNRGVTTLARMRAQNADLQPVLKRYLQAQLSQAMFPFAGLGNHLSERITIIGVRFATMKLALATLEEHPTAKDVIEVIQVLSRFLDHLADPTLMLSIYHETGWAREPRLRAILCE